MANDVRQIPKIVSFGGSCRWSQLRVRWAATAVPGRELLGPLVPTASCPLLCGRSRPPAQARDAWDPRGSRGQGHVWWHPPHTLHGRDHRAPERTTKLVGHRGRRCRFPARVKTREPQKGRGRGGCPSPPLPPHPRVTLPEPAEAPHPSPGSLARPSVP